MTIMTIKVVAAGAVDHQGLGGTAVAWRSWEELEIQPEAGRIRWKKIFDSPYDSFRRLDRFSRILSLAVEASGLSTCLADELRPDTALVLASAHGCLHSDLRFARSLLVPAGIEPGVFPYTLPSTVLGELAIHYGLCGPSLCLSVEPGAEAEGICEARALLEGGEAKAALVCLGDWLPQVSAQATGTDCCLGVVALLLQAGDPVSGGPVSGVTEVGDLIDSPSSHDPPIRELIKALRRACPDGRTHR